MVAWVKEVENVLTWEDMRNCIKPQIVVQRLEKVSEVQLNDSILVSKSDKDKIVTDKRIIVVEDVLDKVYESILLEYEYNYDYIYLKNILQQTQGVETIISGSSYGLLGIENSFLRKEVCCALHSQDLYYSMKCIEYIYDRNEQIKNIVLCCNPYYLYSDLSRTENRGEKERIARVYQPLFGDCNNCLVVPAHQNFLVESAIFDVRKIYNNFVAYQKNEYYFKGNKNRASMAVKMWDDKEKTWQQLTEDEKEKAGKERASLHNKNLSRILSYEQNKALFKSLARFCKVHQIKLFLILTPATKYYRNYLAREFYDGLIDFLNSMDETIHFLDLYESSEYTEEDFNDTDHLSDLGARKFTKAVLELIGSL